MGMYANNRTRIRCPCARCKEGVLLDPFDRGYLKVHLLMNGFMDGYTRWIREGDDDDTPRAGNNDMGLDEEMTDRHADDGAGHGGEESGNDDGGGEDSDHGKEESGYGREEAAVTPQFSTLLSAVVETLMFETPFARVRLAREMLLERRPSWRNLK